MHISVETYILPSWHPFSLPACQQIFCHDGEIIELLHLSKVEGPCIRPPPVVLDGIGGILKFRCLLEDTR